MKVDEDVMETWMCVRRRMRKEEKRDNEQIK